MSHNMLDKTAECEALLPSLVNHEVVGDPSGGLLPFQVVITHDVLQGLREVIFQHGLYGVEPSEFSETEKDPWSSR